MSSLECARVSIGEERKTTWKEKVEAGKDSDTLMVTFHDACDNDDKSTSTAAQPHTTEKEKGSSNEAEEKEIEEGGSKEVKRTGAKHENRKQRPEQQQHIKKGKHYEKRTKKKVSPSFCYKQKNVRSLTSSDRIEILTREVEGCKWDAPLQGETWRPSKAEQWESQQGPILMGAGKVQNKHGVEILLNRTWQK